MKGERIKQSIAEKLWKVLGKKETHPDILKKEDVVKFVHDCAKREQRIKRCAINIETQPETYRVLILMLDEKNNEIEHGNGCWGREIIAKTLDLPLQSWMNGKELKVIDVKEI